MRNRWTGLIVAVAVLMSVGCMPRGCGQEHTSVPMKPSTVKLTSKMATGTGTASFTPQGQNVEIQILADGLPAPTTYSLWLSGGNDAGHGNSNPIGEIQAVKGHINFKTTVSLAEAAKWEHLELMHQPSGKSKDFSDVHAALVGNLPADVRGTASTSP